MFSGRIEMPIEEYNSMKQRIEEYEKIINSISKDTSKFKEENETLRSLLIEISELSASERIFSWKDIQKKINNLVIKDDFNKEEK